VPGLGLLRHSEAPSAEVEGDESGTTLNRMVAEPSQRHASLVGPLDFVGDE
jgi:hypothetical protein